MRRPGKGVAGVAVALVIAGVAGGVLSRSLLRTGASTSQTAAARVVVLFNQQRAARGLRPLESDARLVRAAQSHSDSMLRRQYFAHDGPQGTWDVRVHRFTKRGLVAEVIAYGSGRYSTPRGLMNAWMHSPEHRRIILMPGLRLVGLGLATGTFHGQSGTAMATADFSS